MDYLSQTEEDPIVSVISRNDVGDKTEPEQNQQRKGKGCFPVRYNLMILGWVATAAAYSLRIDLSIAMVAMVNQTFAKNIMTNGTHDFESFCPSPYNKSTSKNGNALSTGSIDWTPSQQGMVLAAFFVGYFFSQIPWGILAQKWGGKNTVGFGLLVCSLLSIMTPTAAETSFILTLILRGLMGISQGSVYPGLMSLIGKWVPTGERSKFSTIIGTGSSGGAIASIFLTAFFSGHPSLGGWYTPFYIFGGSTCIWLFFWMAFIYNFPAEHPKISKEELIYIEASLASVAAQQKDLKVPWRYIVKSMSIWSLCILMFCNSWLYYVLLTFMPTYMEVILGLDMDDNGRYSCLPYLAGMLGSWFGGIVADYMINKGVKINTTRKTMVLIGLIPESLTLISVAFLGCDSKMVILMFILTNAFGGLADAGLAVDLIDIAPRYSGVIYGMANCIANFSGVLAPLVTGYITNVEETLDQWKKVFFLASGLNTFGVLLFVTLAKIEKASWADGITPAEGERLITTEDNILHPNKYGTVKS